MSWTQWLQYIPLPVDKRSAEQQDVSKTYADQLKANMGSQQDNLARYQGQGESALQNMVNRAQAPTAQARTAADFNATGRNAIANPYEINTATTENYYNNAIRDPAQRAWQQETSPQLQEQMKGNFWSTARNNAMQNSYQDMQNNLSAQHAKLAYDDEQARRQMLDTSLNRNLNQFNVDNQNYLSQDNLQRQQELTALGAMSQMYNPTQMAQMQDSLYNQGLPGFSTAGTVDHISYANQPGQRTGLENFADKWRTGNGMVSDLFGTIGSGIGMVSGGMGLSNMFGGGGSVGAGAG